MMEKRRIGTFTLGVCLLLSGILFLVHIFARVMDYSFLFHLWPIVFILLGGEILFYTLRGETHEMKYDYASVILILLLAVFAMGMAGMDLLFEHVPADYWIRIS